MHVNRQEMIEDRRSGMSLTQVAKKHDISRASVCIRWGGLAPDGSRWIESSRRFFLGRGQPVGLY